MVVEKITIRDLESILDKVQKECPEIETIFLVGASFSVWKLKIRDHDKPVDLALARTERSFGVGHRDFEISVENVSIEEDSSRRDFTMNALYLELMISEDNRMDAVFHDFHGGICSILMKQIECVGNPRDRFQEDPLRMLRALRFKARFPGFQIEEKTSEAILELCSALLQTIPKERIAEEILKSMLGNPRTSFHNLGNYGIFQTILPELSEIDHLARERTIQRIEHLQRNDPSLLDPAPILAALLMEVDIQETEKKMREHLARAKMDIQFFSSIKVHQIARRVRLPGIKQITQLCADTLLLMNYNLLENADALLEEAVARYSDPSYLMSLYRANQTVMEREEIDFLSQVASRPPASIDFRLLIKNTGIPMGPHLTEIKFHLRQAEIEGRIASKEEAQFLLNRLYMDNTHIIQEHIERVKEIAGSKPEGTKVPKKLLEKVRWLLFINPIRLIHAYHQEGVLSWIFPELTEAEGTVLSTAHHFVNGYLNDSTIALSLLFEEIDNPTLGQILSVLFLDIGKSRTKRIGPKGRLTYYGHDRVGAEMAKEICTRLCVDESITRDVQFIIRNHNVLVTKGGTQRFRRLMESADESLLDDLLLIHKVDQTSKMKIQAGRRINEGQLDNYHFIQDHMAEWRKQITEKRNKSPEIFQGLLTSTELMSENPSWGKGSPEGPIIGKLKTHLFDWQRRGEIQTKEQAIKKITGHVVLFHLLEDPIEYLEYLRERGWSKAILPEIYALLNIEQTSAYHMEDAYTHTLKVIRSLPDRPSPELIMAAIFHDVGKADTISFDDEKGVYHFFGHERRSKMLFERVNERFEWKSGEVDYKKVLWLIENHMRAKPSCDDVAQAKKRAETVFFKTRSHEEVPKDYRHDLIALVEADTIGAVCREKEMEEKRIVRCQVLRQLVQEVERERILKKQNSLLKEKVKTVWNGHSVQRHFEVSGPKIGKIVKTGQDYVLKRFNEGAKDVSESEVLAFLKTQDL